MNEVNSAGLEKGLEDLDVSEEFIFHPGLFDRIFRGCIGGFDILDDLFGSDLEEEYYEE